MGGGTFHGGGLTLVLAWLMAGWGVASVMGGGVGQTKGPVAPETTGAPILLHAFSKAAKLQDLVSSR